MSEVFLTCRKPFIFVFENTVKHIFSDSITRNGTLSVALAFFVSNWLSYHWKIFRNTLMPSRNQKENVVSFSILLKDQASKKIVRVNSEYNNQFPTLLCRTIFLRLLFPGCTKKLIWNCFNVITRRSAISVLCDWQRSDWHWISAIPWVIFCHF